MNLLHEQLIVEGMLIAVALIMAAPAFISDWRRWRRKSVRRPRA
jgi:hypothetical protein